MPGVLAAISPNSNLLLHKHERKHPEHGEVRGLSLLPRKWSCFPFVSPDERAGTSRRQTEKGTYMKRLLLLAAVTAGALVPASAAAAAQCYEIEIPKRPTLYVCI